MAHADPQSFESKRMVMHAKMKRYIRRLENMIEVEYRVFDVYNELEELRLDLVTLRKKLRDIEAVEEDDFQEEFQHFTDQFMFMLESCEELEDDEVTPLANSVSNQKILTSWLQIDTYDIRLTV